MRPPSFHEELDHRRGVPAMILGTVEKLAHLDIFPVGPVVWGITLHYTNLRAAAIYTVISFVGTRRLQQLPLCYPV